MFSFIYQLSINTDCLFFTRTTISKTSYKTTNNAKDIQVDHLDCSLLSDMVFILILINIKHGVSGEFRNGCDTSSGFEGRGFRKGGVPREKYMLTSELEASTAYMRRTCRCYEQS